jgi:glucosamine kinase
MDRRQRSTCWERRRTVRLRSDGVGKPKLLVNRAHQAPDRTSTSAHLLCRRTLRPMGIHAIPFVYAVDAGGSRTSVSVARGGEALCDWMTDSFAIATAGVEDACATLTALMRDIKAYVGRDGYSVGCVSSSSMPAAGEAPPPEQLISVLTRHGPVGRVVLVNDVLPLLWSPELCGHGIVVCSGTGSSVIGRDVSGRMIKIGGHEHILSDQGSAYSIAREGLRAAARDVDGTGDAAHLRRLAESFFDRGIPAMGRWLAELPRARQTVASFAPMVTAAAAEGDDAAFEIIQREADCLALAAQVAFRRLNDNAPPRIGLAGGVLRGSSTFLDLLRKSLERRGLTDEKGENLRVLDGVECARNYALLAPSSDAARAAVGGGLDGLVLRIGAG